MGQGSRSRQSTQLGEAWVTYGVPESHVLEGVLDDGLAVVERALHPPTPYTRPGQRLSALPFYLQRVLRRA